MGVIRIKNAYLHNLKNVCVDIPKNKFVVVTGVSGSGKTSLIADILDEAGSCDYLESLGLSQDASVHSYYESIYGLNPTISVKSSNESRWNPRSLVGTKTGILNYLRLLYLTEGKITCERCGQFNRINRDHCACGSEVPAVDSRELSFYSSFGKCMECNGTGYVVDIDLNIIYNNCEKTLPELCTLIPECAPLKNQLTFFAEALNINLKQSFEEQPILVQNAFCKGLKSTKSNFRGIEPYLKKLYMEGKYTGNNIHKYVCSECKGERLGKNGRSIKIRKVSLPEVSQYTIKELRSFIVLLSDQISTTDFGKDICRILIKQLDDLIHVGLGYLNLYRTIPSLSGGEFQRLKLAALLQNTMEDLVIIADEILTGLHPTEKNEVLNQMRLLCERGNTVILIEHNLEAIKRADHIIDFGVYGGMKGGNIIYCGSYEGLLQCRDSITARYIKKSEDVFLLSDNNKGAGSDYLFVKNACVNNLKNIDVQIPLHTLVGITGISGSGKSSLIAKTLVPLLKKYFDSMDNESGDTLEDEIYDRNCNGFLDGNRYIDGYVFVSQYPIGRNNRSSVATYLGIMRCLQAIFAKQEQARERNLKTKDFSFNSSGACGCCNGTGQIKLQIGEGSFIETKCQECDGTRFRKDVLKVDYKGKSIAQVLDMTVDEALDFFYSEKEIRGMLLDMESLGLGYLALGQPTPTLSGGEGQRVKLAKSLLENKKNMLYLFDEPTIGLSLYDIDNLNQIFRNLIKRGHSVIVIEHDIITLSNCQWIIEMGPGADSLGGKVIAEGTPYELKRNCASHIGTYLL